MDPQKATCPNPACPLHGQTGQGNIRLHSQKGVSPRTRLLANPQSAPHDEAHRPRSSRSWRLVRVRQQHPHFCGIYR